MCLLTSVLSYILAVTLKHQQMIVIHTLGGFQLSDTPETTGLGIITDSKIGFDKYIRPTSVARKAHIRKKNLGYSTN